MMVLILLEAQFRFIYPLILQCWLLCNYSTAQRVRVWMLVSHLAELNFVSVHSTFLDVHLKYLLLLLSVVEFVEIMWRAHGVRFEHVGRYATPGHGIPKVTQSLLEG